MNSDSSDNKDIKDNIINEKQVEKNIVKDENYWKDHYDDNWGCIREWNPSMSYDSNRIAALKKITPYNRLDNSEYADLWNEHDEYKTNRGRAKARWVQIRKNDPVD